MEFAKTKYTKSLPETMRCMPVGKEQIISGEEWPKAKVRGTANDLKKQGFAYQVRSSRKSIDTYVTRLA